jgi:ABC-2 type transport system permease protein
MNPVFGIAIKDIKVFLREKGSLFWTIVFPILILFLYSAIFGREVPFVANIAIVDMDNTQLTNNIIYGLNQTEVLQVKMFQDNTSALEALKNGEINSVLTFPEGFSENLTHGTTYIVLSVDETNPDVADIIHSVIQGFFSKFASNPVTIKEGVSISREKLGYKEFLLPGILTYPFLFSSMVAATSAIVYERELGTLKRIRVSPAHPLSVLWGKTLATMAQTAISLFLISTLAFSLLNPKVNWNLPLLIPIMVLGSINGISIGLLISCIARSPSEASNAAVTIGVFLQFFIGMYFPVEFLPEYLQTASNVIPMTYAAKAMRDIMLRNAGFDKIFPTMIILTISAVIIYITGIFLYRRWVTKE